MLIGFAAACFGFLAFNVRPASLFVGRGGRLGIGFTLAVGALAVDPVPVSWRELTTPLILLGIFLLDGLLVTGYRLRRRRSLFEHRNDHLLHRLVALGWSTSEAVGFLVVAQLFLAVIALFTARGVFPLWLSAASTIIVLLVVGVEAARARLEREQPRGLPVWAWMVVLLLVVWLVAATAPLALAANDTVDLMQNGRESATRALNAARDGDTHHRARFLRAGGTVVQRRARQARFTADVHRPGRAVPRVERAGRAHLAEIGTDLADAGESLTAAVEPDALEVVDGRLPSRRSARSRRSWRTAPRRWPAPEPASTTSAADPYLVGPVREAVDKVYGQLTRADREAAHAAAAAKLAPAIFGAEGDRTYLLVVQNNAESRATGGFIGSYALITAHDGELDVGEMQRTRIWNEAIAENADVTYDAPD